MVRLIFPTCTPCQSCSGKCGNTTVVRFASWRMWEHSRRSQGLCGTCQTGGLIPPSFLSWKTLSKILDSRHKCGSHGWNVRCWWARDILLVAAFPVVKVAKSCPPTLCLKAGYGGLFLKRCISKNPSRFGASWRPCFPKLLFLVKVVTRCYTEADFLACLKRSALSLEHHVCMRGCGCVYEHS